MQRVLGAGDPGEPRVGGVGALEQPGVRYIEERASPAAGAFARVRRRAERHALRFAGRAGPDRRDRQDVIRRSDAHAEPCVDLFQEPGDVTVAHREQADPGQQAFDSDELLAALLGFVVLLKQPGDLSEVGVADQDHAAHVEVVQGAAGEKLLSERFPECLAD